MTIPNISVKFFENSYQVEFSSALIYIYFHSSSFFHSFSIFFLKFYQVGFPSGLARNLHQLERVMRGKRNPKEIPSGEQQTNMIMDYVSQESLS